MLLYRHPLRLLRHRLTQGATVPLGDLDPTLAQELRERLRTAGEDHLAHAAADLSIAEACRCDDSECASFYAVDRFRAAWYWGRTGRTIPLRPGLSIDAVGERIIAVEVHHRPSFKLALQQLRGTQDQSAHR